MSEQLKAIGIASSQPSPDLNHTYQIGVGKEGQFSGLANTFVDPHIGKELEAGFETISKSKLTPTEFALKLTAGVTSVGKYAQVILNPGSYPTNFLGGVSTEIFNGRISLDGKGVKAYLNSERLRSADRDSSIPYGVVEQNTFRARKNSEILSEGGVNSIPLVALTTELQQGGILDSNVIANDLKASTEAAFGEHSKKVTGFFSKLYQVPDNRIKHAAFAHELSKNMKASPDESFGDAVTKALADVRATTQNYDMVPAILKKLSSHGIVVPTYISFKAELIRNTINTARLAVKELRSGNPVLQRAGAKRVAGMALTAGAIHMSVTALSSWMSGLGEDERDKLESLKEPWLKDSKVIYLGSPEGQLAYFDPEYIVPQADFYNALAFAFDEAEEGNFLNAAFTPIKNLSADFRQLNIFTKVAAQMISNSDQNGQDIYNPEVDGTEDKAEKLATHMVENMLTPGVVRTFNKMKKAQEHETGYGGSIVNGEDLALYFLGVRPYRKDLTHEKFLLDPLKQYRFRSSDIRKGLNQKEL